MPIVPVEISTVGAHVRWHVENQTGVRPTANYTELIGVSTAPAFDMVPEAVDCSTLADNIKQYIAGQQDPGSDAQFVLNHSEAAIQSWEELVTAAKVAAKQKKRVWFEYAYKSGKKSYYFCAQPLPLGNSGIEQNTISTITAHTIPNGKCGWYARSVYNIIYIGTDNKFYAGSDNKVYSGFNPDYEERM